MVDIRAELQKLFSTQIDMDAELYQCSFSVLALTTAAL
mgnify:FL=1|jgi:hypothetical protein